MAIQKPPQTLRLSMRSIYASNTIPMIKVQSLRFDTSQDFAGPLQWTYSHARRVLMKILYNDGVLQVEDWLDDETMMGYLMMMWSKN